jgi:zinc-ribbon domain
VISCKQCGAELPDDARFCLQCGNRVEQEQPAEPQLPRVGGAQPDLEFVQPALTGGMFLGILSSIPFISAGNLLCCAWVVLGGAMAAVLLTRQRPSGITYGDGAFVGVLSGLFGAIVGTVVHMSFLVIASRLFETQQQDVEQMLQQLGIQGPARDWMLRLASGEISAFTLIFTFFSNLVVFSLFAMIGGILTVAILKKGNKPR